MIQWSALGFKEFVVPQVQRVPAYMGGCQHIVCIFLERDRDILCIIPGCCPRAYQETIPMCPPVPFEECIFNAERKQFSC